MPHPPPSSQPLCLLPGSGPLPPAFPPSLLCLSPQGGLLSLLPEQALCVLEDPWGGPAPRLGIALALCPSEGRSLTLLPPTPAQALGALAGWPTRLSPSPCGSHALQERPHTQCCGPRCPQLSSAHSRDIPSIPTPTQNLHSSWRRFSWGTHLSSACVPM